MPPKASGSTSKYSSVSASSFLDLKAELSQREDEFKRNKASGGSSTTLGAKRAATGKPSVWARQNKGVGGRNDKDAAQYSADTPTGQRDAASIKAALERKAGLYDKIRKGKSGGLTEGQIDNLLVDFDRKAYDNPTDSDSSEDDEDGSTQRAIVGESDPMVEHTDEFGRTRMMRRSEIPRDPGAPFEDMPAESNVQYGDQYSFPVYTPDADVLAARAAAYAASEPLIARYNAAGESRSKAAGFYAFSGDEETRREQIEALARERDETERKRVEVEESGGVVGAREREREERKAKVLEKRREVELKRKRLAASS